MAAIGRETEKVRRYSTCYQDHSLVNSESRIAKEFQDESRVTFQLKVKKDLVIDHDVQSHTAPPLNECDASTQFFFFDTREYRSALHQVFGPGKCRELYSSKSHPFTHQLSTIVMAPSKKSKSTKSSESIATRLGLVVKSGKYTLGYKSALKQMRSGKG